MSTLFEKIQTYIRKYDLSPTRFGMLVANNPMLYWRIEKGDYTMRTANKIHEFIKFPPIEE